MSWEVTELPGGLAVEDFFVGAVELGALSAVGRGRVRACDVVEFSGRPELKLLYIAVERVRPGADVFSGRVVTAFVFEVRMGACEPPKRDVPVPPRGLLRAVDVGRRSVPLEVGGAVSREKVVWRAVEERDGPSSFLCSPNLLDVLTPTDDLSCLEWRARCRTRLAVEAFEELEELAARVDDGGGTVAQVVEIARLRPNVFLHARIIELDDVLNSAIGKRDAVEAEVARALSAARGVEVPAWAVPYYLHDGLVLTA